MVVKVELSPSYFLSVFIFGVANCNISCQPKISSSLSSNLTAKTFTKFSADKICYDFSLENTKIIKYVKFA